MSVFQFSFTISNAKTKCKYSTGFQKHVDIIFGSEIWAIGLIFFLQDFPFLIGRLIILINFKLSKNYMIYYMIIKNFILCAIEIYRIMILYKEEVHKESENKAKDTANISSHSENNIEVHNLDENITEH